MVSRTYTNIEIDMDLFAPFLSATKILVDTASQEDLQMIDTENVRYVWDGNDWIIFVLAVSKGARLGHMRFLLNYALTEFMRIEVPRNSDIQSTLKDWTGAPKSFTKFETLLDELIDQFEATDESLVAGKAMDCLAVYSHLFRAIMRVKLTKKKRKALADRIQKLTVPLFEKEPALKLTEIDENGVDVLGINPHESSYKNLREALEELLRIVAEATKKTATASAFKTMIFDELMVYVKRDLSRLQLYYILDDVVRHVF
jgi:hypothetical protein